MRHIRSAAITTAVLIILLIVLAEALRPMLPWLVALVIFGGIVRLAMRS
jgi:hypothetical protein